MDCCDICGDIGVVEAIITCSQCKINCEHTYCFRIPVEAHIEGWVCEECENSSKQKPLASSSSGELPQVSRLNNSVEVQNSSGLRSKSRKLLNGSWEKKVATGKTRYITANEAIKLSSGENKPLASANVTRQSKPSRPEIGVRILERTPIKPRTVPAGFPSREGLASGHVAQPKPQRLGNIETSKRNQPKFKMLSEVHNSLNTLQPSQAPTYKNSQEQKPREVQSPQTKASRLMKMTSAAPSPNASQLTISGGTGHTTTELRISNAENVNTNLFPDSNESSCYPALDALWKGNFSIGVDHRHGELNHQIRAHPPSKVRRKIYEFSKKMPEVLDFQMVPRQEHWSRLFKEIIPDEKDVGLYFFPSIGERSEDYISLVELIIVKDVALRKQIADVELLVFTSKLLPDNCQCWEGRNFLWGVFHRLKPSDRFNQVCFNEDDDMEIDMISGMEVGRKDVIVNKRQPLTEKKCARFKVLEADDLLVPPGFEERVGPKVGVRPH